MINRRALFKNVNKADSLYEPTTAYPTAGPKPNMNSSNPVALPSSGTGMHSLIIGINNGVNIVPHTPEIDYVVMIPKCASKLNCNKPKTFPFTTSIYLAIHPVK